VNAKGVLGFLFALLVSVLGFVAGTFIGGVFFVPASSGLAGLTIALGYGVVGFGIGLVGSLVLIRTLAVAHLRRALVGAGILVLLVIAVLSYRYVRVRSAQRPAAESRVTVDRRAPASGPFRVVAEARPSRAVADGPVGLGFVQPRLLSGQRLYFYARPDADQLAEMMTPVDSLVFGAGRQHVDITMAPPWFWPEVMKLDYDLLFLRALTLTKNWIEVVVNTETGQTSWVDRHAVAFIDWPDFLLDVYAVEVTDPAANKVLLKPLDHAAVLADASIPLTPLAVQGSWLQVSTNGLADRIVPTGWIRWRDGDRLLITFSLLS
jgi:hypothetical protein